MASCSTAPHRMGVSAASAGRVFRGMGLHPKWRKTSTNLFHFRGKNRPFLIQRLRIAAVPDAAAAVKTLEAGAQARAQTQNKLIAASCLAFVISNMDKVNISIAIIPMAQEFGWGTSEMGLIQSTFFAGYILSNIPGGYMASRLGGRRVLPVGLSIWSLATALVPLSTGSISTLGLSRAVVGLGQAVAPVSVVDMLARIVPKEERASAVSLAFAGLHVGSIVGLLAAPALINLFGWRALFVVFGSAGLVWYLAFEAAMRDILRDDPEAADKLTMSMTASDDKAKEQSKPQIPYRAFLRTVPVRALCFTHFANNWFHYTMLAWLPAYFTAVLDLKDLGDAAHTSVIPPIAGIICSVLAGPVADKLIGAGLPLPRIRAIMQCIAMFGPASCLLAATLDSSSSQVPLITLSLGLSSFSLAGLYCTHSDMSPKYAGALLGVTNTMGAVAGILGVSAVGLIRDATQSWDAALLLPNIVVLTMGGICYATLCKNEAIDFDAADNSPFAFESALEPPKRALGSTLHGLLEALERILPKGPPKEDVREARRKRLNAQRATILASAASLDSFSSSPSTPSFAATVTSSISGFQSSRSGADSSGTETLVSHWTMATVIPDFGPVDDDWEGAELLEAEGEVEKIMQQLRP